MRVDSSTPRHGAGLAWFAVPLFAALLATSCERDNRALPQPLAGTAVANVSIGDDSAWDTLVADITINERTIDSSGRTRNRIPIRYRFERSRSGSGWKTVLTLESRARKYVRPGRGPFDPEAHEIARIETDENGDIRTYNGHGDEVRMPSAEVEQVTIAKIGGDPTPPPPLPVAPSLKIRSTSAWTAEFLVLTSRHSSRQRAIERFWGKPVSSNASTLVYSHAIGNVNRQLQFDAQVGVPTRTTITRGPVTQTTDENYQLLADGTAIKRSEHSEVLNGRGERLVTDVIYQNAHLEKRASK